MCWWPYDELAEDRLREAARAPAVLMDRMRDDGRTVDPRLLELVGSIASCLRDSMAGDMGGVELDEAEPDPEPEADLSRRMEGCRLKVVGVSIPDSPVRVDSGLSVESPPYDVCREWAGRREPSAMASFNREVRPSTMRS